MLRNRNRSFHNLMKIVGIGPPITTKLTASFPPIGIKSGLSANDPIADVPIVCHVLPMSTQEFVSQQRDAVNFLFGTITVCLLMLWLWAALDWAFALGWNADPQLLWAAPLMAIFAYGLRFFCLRIFGFVKSNY